MKRKFSYKMDSHTTVIQLLNMFRAAMNNVTNDRTNFYKLRIMVPFV